jgi:hypothetical protein
VIEHGEGKIVDVGRNAEAEHQHQQRRAEQAEAEPYRVAQQLQRLADRVGEQTSRAEPTARRRRGRASSWRVGARDNDLFRRRACARRFGEITDESVL